MIDQVPAERANPVAGLPPRRGRVLLVVGLAVDPLALDLVAVVVVEDLLRIRGVDVRDEAVAAGLAGGLVHHLELLKLAKLREVGPDGLDYVLTNEIGTPDRNSVKKSAKLTKSH